MPTLVYEFRIEIYSANPFHVGDGYYTLVVGDKPFEFKGTNGFMITFDITSKDIKS